MRRLLVPAGLLAASLASVATSKPDPTPARPAASEQVRSVPTPTPREVPEIFWTTGCTGDLARDDLPAACPPFTPDGFDPLGQDGPADRLLAIVELPPGTEPVPLAATLAEGRPVCTECEGSCFALEEEVATRATWTLAPDPQQTTRHLVDVGARVSSWKLVHLRVTAELPGRTAELGAAGWAWCP